MSTCSRLLSLLVLLQVPHRWAGPDLAAHLGVTDRTIRRDIRRMRDLGHAVRATLGRAGGYELGPGPVLPLLALDPGEAVLAATGLALVATAAEEATAETALRALARLQGLLPGPVRSSVARHHHALAARCAGDSGADPFVLGLLARAIAAGDRAWYDELRGGPEPERCRVRPAGLVVRDGRWHLVGFDEMRRAWRVIDLRRIVNPRIIPATLPNYLVRHFLPGGLDARSFVRDWLRGQTGGP